MVCVGAISTDAVLHLAEDAQSAGADALLLPAMSYQPLRNEEVYALFETVTRHTSVPVCVYDNPGTTHFRFTDELLGQLSSLKGFAQLKFREYRIPPSLRLNASQHYENIFVRRDRVLVVTPVPGWG